MNLPAASFRVHVDPANPGQFFACCGLLEVAEKLSPGVESWFEGTEFNVLCQCDLESILHAAKSIRLGGVSTDQENEESDDEDESDEDEEETVGVIEIKYPFKMQLDWWSNKSLKTWAGSMKADLIFLALCGAIDPSCLDPFNQVQVVYSPNSEIGNSTPGHVKRKPKKLKKREPFYFDSRRGANSKTLSIGFTPDKIMPTCTNPVVEALCFIGLQRCRPIPTQISRQFLYHSWSVPYTLSILPAAISGYLSNRKTVAYQFTNDFRTGQKKHKAYQPAQPLH